MYLENDLDLPQDVITSCFSQPLPTYKFYTDALISFGAITNTDKQADRQIDICTPKHNLLDRDDKTTE